MKADDIVQVTKGWVIINSNGMYHGSHRNNSKLLCWTLSASPGRPWRNAVASAKRSGFCCFCVLMLVDQSCFSSRCTPKYLLSCIFLISASDGRERFDFWSNSPFPALRRRMFSSPYWTKAIITVLPFLSTLNTCHYCSVIRIILNVTWLRVGFEVQGVESKLQAIVEHRCSTSKFLKHSSSAWQTVVDLSGTQWPWWLNVHAHHLEFVSYGGWNKCTKKVKNLILTYPVSSSKIKWHVEDSILHSHASGSQTTRGHGSSPQ